MRVRGIRMLVQKLSDMTGFNLETIRYYRKQGFLKPVKNDENGYWEYDPLDQLVLFQFRLLRLENISLESIREMFFPAAQERPAMEIQDLDRQIRTLELEKARIDQKIKVLSIARDHLLQTPEMKQVTCKSVSRDKYVCSSDDATAKAAQYCSENVIPYSMNIMFDASILNSPLETSRIPVTIPLGFYEGDASPEDMVTLRQFCSPDVIPAGEYVMAVIKCADPSYLEASSLIPLQEYAVSHKLRFTGKTASFITGIDYSGQKPAVYFRLRLEVVSD